MSEKTKKDKKPDKKPALDQETLQNLGRAIGAVVIEPKLAGPKRPEQIRGK